MKSKFLSETVMSLLHRQGLNLAYESAVAQDYEHMLICECSGSCTGDCHGGCMGDCADGCFDSCHGGCDGISWA